MKASIISIGFGYEKGFLEDKSRIYLCQKLFEKGFNINGVFISEEDSYKLQFFIKIALDKSDIVFIISSSNTETDLLIRETISESIGVPLVFNESWLKTLKERYPENFQNIKHFAKLPYNAKPIKNKNGEFLGFIKVLDDVNKAIVFLPDEKNQLRDMLNLAFEYLQVKDRVVYTGIVRTYGLSLEEINEFLSDFDNKFLNASPKGIDIYLWDKEIEFLKNKKSVLSERIGKYIYAYQNEEMEEVIGKLLKEKGLTVSTAESSTGGLIASRIVNVSGSSTYFLGSIVAYSNSVKENLLKVSDKILKTKGAVSEEVALQMAESVAKLLDTNFGISDTGIAGPTGATKEKPLGLHYIGLYFNGETKVEKVIFKGERNQVRLRISQHALNMLRVKLLSF
ncbi:MAG TPA: nicotinamide-nucleotide amidohydrolase family protein [Persephonella sp.]|nr:nicotinamide-nucleotide amidohydrolase family protein [Hydrogenothermaceae bacterium]HIQ24418.1 nicotinamide-nucleotide amidohydrolase family protein [Persephonella sp.]